MEPLKHKTDKNHVTYFAMVKLPNGELGKIPIPQATNDNDAVTRAKTSAFSKGALEILEGVVRAESHWIWEK